MPTTKPRQQPPQQAVLMPTPEQPAVFAVGDVSQRLSELPDESVDLVFAACVARRKHGRPEGGEADGGVGR